MEHFSIVKKNSTLSQLGRSRVIEQLGLNSFLYSKDFDFYAYTTDDTSIIRSRQNIMRDMINIPEFVDIVMYSVDMLEIIEELNRKAKEDGDNEVSLYAIKEVETYVEFIEHLHARTEKAEHAACSEEVTAFLHMIDSIYASEDYTKLREAVSTLSVQVKSVSSITLGINLDGAMTPYEAGIISVNTEYFQSGDLLSKFMRMDFSDNPKNTIAPLAPVGKRLSMSEKAAIGNSINGVLKKMVSLSCRSWKKMMDSYFNNGVELFVNMKQDFIFLKTCFGIIQKMTNFRLPICFPELSEREKKNFCAKGLYNPIIADYMAETGQSNRVVRNDFAFDHEGMIYILTGPNQGGKSVLLSAVGIAQFMTQLGLPIAAEEATVSPADNILIHFSSKGVISAKNGRFADECERLQTSIKCVTADSLVLLDESFSGTDAFEATAIAKEVLHAFGIIGCRGIFSTHLHQLTSEIKEVNQDARVLSKFDNLVMQADHEVRTYKLQRQEPDNRSYANTIANKYGLSTERILQDFRNASGEGDNIGKTETV